MKSWICALLVVSLPLQLIAQVAPQPKSGIGEVTLFGEEQLKVEAATKTEIPISKAPSAVTVVTAKQIQESGARTVPDLLRLVAGVNVRWNPMVQTVDIRGFGENPFSNRVLLLIDGTPLNSGDTGGFPLSPSFDFFPIQNIKRVEVVRGPGSSLYGENAYWGVINIVTLSGEDLAGGDAQIFGGGVRGTGTITAQYGTRLTNGSVLGSVRLLQSEFPVEMWMDDDSKFRAADVFVKGVLGGFQLSLYRHDDRMDGFAEELGGELGLPPTSQFASAHQIRQTLDVASLKYSHAPTNAKVTFAADLSWSHRNGMHCAGCHAAQEKEEFAHPENHGYQAIGDFRLGLHMIPAHDVLLGVEARRLDRGEHKHELSPGGAIVAGYDKIAAYAQDQFAIVPNRLSAVAGVRYDAKTDLFPARTSPRLALVYTPSDRLVLRSGYSTAFRFPNFSELYQSSWFLTLSSSANLFPPFPLVTFVPNEQLKPEEIRTFELGGEYQLSPRVSAKADLYRSKVSEFMVINVPLAPPPAPSGVHFENQMSDATVFGGELELRANFDGITGFANWAHQSESAASSAVDSTGTPFEFPYAPKNKLNLGAYAGPFQGWRGAVEASWRSQYRAPAIWFLIRSGLTDPTTHPLPGYTLLNARLSYDLPMHSRVSRPITLSLFANNLLDKRPEETLVGTDSRIVGREIFGQVEVHF